MSNPKISIIIPVYNIEKYIAACLDSLINQTMKDIEIICVNDGSPDGSPEILNQYAQKDERVIVLNQSNQKVSYTRNNGMKLASGEYILFVDGDDWLELNACEVLYDYAKKYNTDVVMFSCRLEYANKTLFKYAFEQDFIEFTGEECKILHRRHAGMIGAELTSPEKQDYLCSACTKLYKKDIIDKYNLSFYDITKIGSYEDGLFNLFYFKYVQKAVYIKKPFYHYRKDNESSNTSNHKPNLSGQWDHLFDIMESYIAENQMDDDFKQGLQNRIALGMIGLGINCIISDKKATRKIKELRRLLASPRYVKAVKQLSVGHMAVHWKVFFICAKLRLSLAVYLLLIVMNKLRGKV